eukprot:NODE_482_length_7826_cov_0.560114.p1 type:complete len:484 gc:universal NODE_482_length_7826_cov_0.560114:4810-6261(+)
MFPYFALACSLRVIFINDLHGHYENIAGIVRIFNEYRTPDSLLLNGADEFTGTSLFRYYGANKSIEIINELKYDAMTIGNHEFDKGSSYLASYLKQIKIPIVSSNVVPKKNSPLKGLIKPYVIKNGIGIIGSTTPDTLFQTTVTDVNFLPFVASVQIYIDELNSIGIQKILLLSHNGFSDDQKIAKYTKGLSVIIGAHSHSLLTNNATYAKYDTIDGLFPTIITDMSNSSVYIVQAKCYGKYVGYFDVEFTDNVVSRFSGDTVKVDLANVDPAWHKRIQEWEIPVDALYNSVITFNSRTFSHDCFRKSCELAKLIANSIEKYYVEKHRDKSIPTLGIIQSGAIRMPFESGNVTISNVYDALPFDDKVDAVVMLGSTLLKSVNSSIIGHRGKQKVIGYITASNHAKVVIRNGVLHHMMVYHNRRWIKVHCEKRYRVVSSSYLLSGGDNVFPKLTKFTHGVSYVSEAVISIFRKSKNLRELMKFK